MSNDNLALGLWSGGSGFGRRRRRRRGGGVEEDESYPFVHTDAFSKLRRAVTMTRAWPTSVRFALYHIV